MSFCGLDCHFKGSEKQPPMFSSSQQTHSSLWLQSHCSLPFRGATATSVSLGFSPLRWISGLWENDQNREFNEGGAEVEKKTGWLRGCFLQWLLLTLHSVISPSALIPGVAKLSCISAHRAQPVRLVTWAAICPKPFLLFQMDCGESKV